MINIRFATKDDTDLILAFIRDLAKYERAPAEAVATADQIRRHGFEALPKFRVLIADWDHQPAGFALFFYHFSTWQGRPTMFLEDLFVQPAHRGKGIGRALLRRLAEIAVREDCGRMEWQVLTWNTPALHFYETLGAKRLDDWVTMRVSGDALPRLAELRDDSPA